MTRILQIRRGTTDENNAFTGMPGEITMDTTAKTLRIHDGTTLGGFVLARLDDINSTSGSNTESGFDINSVSNDFWESLFAEYQPSAINSNTVNLISITPQAYFESEFTYDKLPAFADAVLVCQTAEAGYSADDEVRAFGIGDYAYPHVNTFLVNNLLHVRLFAGSQSFWVFHKDTGAKTLITNANWKIKFTVYY